jgi:hypothetical protein
MREIEFRGKCIERIETPIESVEVGDWVYGFYYYDLSNMAAVIIATLQCADVGVGSGIAQYNIKVDPETVGQYIERRDLQGNKEYEGDIIRFGTEESVLTCVIELNKEAHDDDYCPYLNGYALRILKEEDYPDNDDSDYSPIIVGNKTDNPELLKGCK